MFNSGTDIRPSISSEDRKLVKQRASWLMYTDGDHASDEQKYINQAIDQLYKEGKIKWR